MKVIKSFQLFISSLTISSCWPNKPPTFSLGDVLVMATLEVLVALSSSRGARDSLLPEPNRLNLVAFLGDNHVRLSWVVRCALRLVVSRYACTLESRIFLRWHYFFFRPCIFLAGFFLAAIPIAGLAFFVMPDFFIPLP